MRRVNTHYGGTNDEAAVYEERERGLIEHRYIFLRYV